MRCSWFSSGLDKHLELILDYRITQAAPLSAIRCAWARSDQPARRPFTERGHVGLSSAADHEEGSVVLHLRWGCRSA
jgi:hypothetical protein